MYLRVRDRVSDKDVISVALCGILMRTALGVRKVSDYQMSVDEGRRNNRINKQQQLINRRLIHVTQSIILVCSGSKFRVHPLTPPHQAPMCQQRSRRAMLDTLITEGVYGKCGQNDGGQGPVWIQGGLVAGQVKSRQSTVGFFFE